MGARVVQRVSVLCVVAALLAACSGGGSDKAAEVDRVVPAQGDVLAEVDGVGQILEGFAVFGTDDPKVTASEAGAVPNVEGVLRAGPGLDAEVATPFRGALQMRLDVPEPPTENAIPVAVHRGVDGRMSIEPALWDPAASQMVVWATLFSDRWGAWFDPRNWIEEVVQVGQGGFDFVTDFITGRTDPPGCRNDRPAWASIAINEVSSLHVCAQSNPADDRTERFELFLKSNRRTAQLVTIPSVTKDYVWAENLSDDYRRVLTSLAGVDGATNTTLLGTYAMSVGFRQPKQNVDFDVLAYQTSRIIVANPVFALLGNLPLEGTLGAMAAVAKCHAEASGIDITRFDLVPDDTRPDVGFLERMVRCAFETLQHPELAVGVVQEVAGAIGLSNFSGLDKVNGALRSLAPTAARIASGLAIGSALTNLGDGIFDNLADGRITIRLAGSTTPTKSAPGEYSVSLDHPAWGPVRLVTRQPSSDGTERDTASISVIDARGAVRWSFEVVLYELAPTGTSPNASDEAETVPIDALGHVFIDYNPGRYNGVIILRPTSSGFNDFETLPTADNGTGRFYAGIAVDIDGDGVYEVALDYNDCVPTCAGGTTYRTTYRWNGRDDYIAVPAPGEVSCGSIAFSTSSEDVAARIRSHGIVCGEARDVVTRVSEEHNFYTGPRSFKSGEFTCTVSTKDDGGLPVGRYRCSSAAGTLTWEKT